MVKGLVWGLGFGFNGSSFTGLGSELVEKFSQLGRPQLVLVE